MMRNRNIKKAIILLMSAILLCGCMLSGCKNTRENNGGMIFEGSGENMEFDNITDFSVDGTTHRYKVGKTDDYLVKDGSSSYKIVVQANAPERIQTAAKDFASFFLEATGVFLPTLYSDDLQYTKDSEYIVIGENRVSEAAGLETDYNVLGLQGFVIRTIGKSVFACGATAEGSQFATYELLTQLFDFDYFGVDTYYIQNNADNVSLMNYDIVDVPDIELRATNYQFLMSDKTTAQRLRLTNFGDLCIPVGGKNVHNSFEYINPNDYPEKKDLWFSTDMTNLCYTARGNAAELEQMQNIVTEKIKESFIENPDKLIITMTHEDTQTLCECPSCNAMKEHYNGSQAASVLIFLNKVCENIEAWFQTEEGKPYERDFQLWFFAYHATNQPPTYYDEAAKEYKPIDDAVIMNPHLVAYFAETNGDYTRSFYDEDSVNAPYANNLKGWTALSEKLAFWMYSTNFSYFLTPYNIFNTTQETYKFAIEHNVDFIYDQGQSNQTGSATGWSWLKIYLYSKLTWNVNQDINLLIQRFMEHYFGPASEIMQDLFYEYKVFATFQRDVLGYTGSRSIFYDVLKTDLWPKQVLLDWQSRMTLALERAETIKFDDYAKYTVYVKNISTERIAINYLLLKLYQATMTAEDVENAKSQFYHDQNLANIGRESERGGTVTALMQNWGII